MNMKMSYWMMPMFRHKEPELILQTVASFYNIEVSDIRRRTNSGRESEARHLCAYFLYESFNKNVSDISSKWGLEKVGKYIGRDHSTVVNSRKVVQNLYDTDVWFKERFNLIKNKINI